MKKFILSLIAGLTLMVAPSFAQTTTSYTLPTGTVCGTLGPEHCTFYAPGTARFQTGDPWTQLVFDSNNADYCFDYTAYQPTSVWQVASVPSLGPTAKLFTLDCATSGLNHAPSGSLHAEIFAYSYTRSYVCGGRIRTICHQTNWQVLDGSFVEFTEPQP